MLDTAKAVARLALYVIGLLFVIDIYGKVADEILGS